MKFTYLCLFPEIIDAFFDNSIMKRAVERGLMAYSTVCIRDFAGEGSSPYHACDDAPYGGGAGMLLKSQPLAKALDSLGARQKLCIYPSPSGLPMQQNLAQALSQLGSEHFAPSLWAADLPHFYRHKMERYLYLQGEGEIVFICGRYEGVDQRIIDQYVDLELSIGDYVLSSGELASLCLTDAIYRLCSGVISAESLQSESFANGLLEYPQYTRPEYFCGQRVPEILLSGHHEKIRQWRLQQSVQRTFQRRPELLQAALKTARLPPEAADMAAGYLCQAKAEKADAEKAEAKKKNIYESTPRNAFDGRRRDLPR